jgi:PAS domain S-box-containing protein
MGARPTGTEMRRLLPPLTSSTVGLAVGITAAVATASAIGAALYSRHHTETLFETARETALAQGELIRAGLEHQMMENDRSLIAKMVEGFGSQAHVASVMLLDRAGVVRFSSAPEEVSRVWSIDSPTCQACHQFPPAERTSSRVIDTAGSSLLRTVIPIRNQPGCHGCHDPRHGINGILVFDVDTAVLRAGTDRDLNLLVFGTGGLALLLIAGIAVVVRLAVLRRLQRFETTARQIAGGDLDRRVPADGSDTISWLAREFNSMADSMSGLLTQVHGQQRRLETVINSIDDGIVVLDARRQVIAANDAFLNRSGRTRDRVVGTSCRYMRASVCTDEACPALACLDTQARQVRVSERTTDAGATRWEEVHASPIVSASGEVTHVVEVWRDITERRAAEARLSESHRLASLGMLASGFSHELNTPLATTLTCVERILRDSVAPGGAPLDRGRVEEAAVMAREQLLRCRGITQHFLRLSRGQTGAADVIDLGMTIAAVARLVEPTARDRGITITTVPPADVVHVRANDAELQHVLINLAINAVQASEPGGQVRLSVAGVDPVRICVRDDGRGIAPADQQRIFEPFFSLQPGGTGLGLFLSLNFVRQWGGDISVESAPGAGSTFEVTLPIESRHGMGRTA